MTVAEFEKRAAYQDGYDRQFDNWKIIDVHSIPSKFNKKHEVDFYCCNGNELFLLRIRHRDIDSFESIKNETITYLVAEFEVNEINNEVLKNVLDKLTINNEWV